MTLVPTHTVRRTARPLRSPHWDDDAWASAGELRVDQFHPRSSDHRPETRVRLLHDDAHLYVRFDVADRYVVSTATGYQQAVCQDSCVEFFVQPRRDRGYFNFEFNCGGTLLLFYIEDPTRCDDGRMSRFTRVPPEEAATLGVYHSMPSVVWPEVGDPVSWRLGCRIPLVLMERYVGPLGPSAARLAPADPVEPWRANFYKCASRSSHPHWASWSPIGERLDFHQPDRFGELRFDE
jgi:hypothetical protein